MKDILGRILRNQRKSVWRLTSEFKYFRLPLLSENFNHFFLGQANLPSGKTFRFSKAPFALKNIKPYLPEQNMNRNTICRPNQYCNIIVEISSVEGKIWLTWLVILKIYNIKILFSFRGNVIVSVAWRIKFLQMVYIILSWSKTISYLSVPFLDASLKLHAGHFLPSAHTTGLLLTTHSNADMQATCTDTLFVLLLLF